MSDDPRLKIKNDPVLSTLAIAVSLEIDRDPWSAGFDEYNTLPATEEVMAVILRLGYEIVPKNESERNR